MLSGCVTKHQSKNVRINGFRGIFSLLRMTSKMVTPFHKVKTQPDISPLERNESVLNVPNQVLCYLSCFTDVELGSHCFCHRTIALESHFCLIGVSWQLSISLSCLPHLGNFFHFMAIFANSLGMNHPQLMRFLTSHSS